MKSFISAANNQRGFAAISIVGILGVALLFFMVGDLVSADRRRNNQLHYRTLAARNRTSLTLRNYSGSPAAIRNSIRGGRNPQLKKCLDSPLSCPTAPSPFVLYGPLSSSAAIAGSKTAAVLYDQFGRPCLPKQAHTCPIQASATFKVAASPANHIEVQVTVGQNAAVNWGVPLLETSEIVTVDINSVLKPTE